MREKMNFRLKSLRPGRYSCHPSPFFAVARPRFQRLFYSVPTRKMHLIVRLVRNRPDIFQVDRHLIWFPLQCVRNGIRRGRHLATCSVGTRPALVGAKAAMIREHLRLGSRVCLVASAATGLVTKISSASQTPQRPNPSGSEIVWNRF